jgi:hypothetical protein
LCGGKADVDGIELANFAGDELREADVGDDDVLFRYFAGLGRENAGHGVGAKNVVDEEMDGCAGFEVKNGADPNRIGCGEKQGCLFGGLARKLSHVMTDEVETDKRDGFAFTVDGGEIFDARSEIERVGELGEMAEEVFREASSRGEDEIGFAREGFDGRVETAGGGLSGQVDGYDNGDSESDGEDSEGGTDGFLPERAEDEAGEQQEGCHESIRPSFILMTRSTTEAASREWVAMMTETEN